MKRKIFNSVFSQIVFICISAVVGLALVPITINMLGKIEYGAFELILSLIIIDSFLEFGLGSTLIKYIPEYKDNLQRLKKFVWSYYYIKICLTFLGVILIVVIGYYFDTLFKLDEVDDIESIKLAVYIFAMGLFISSTATFLTNFLSGFVYFGWVNAARVVSLLLFFLVYYFYYLGNESDTYSIVAIAIIWFVVKPLFLLVSVLGILKYVKLDYILKPEKFEWIFVKSTLKYMFGMTYIVMLAQLYNNLPKIILGILSGPVYVAYWGIMEKVRSPLLQLRNSMLRPLIPILSDTNNMKNMQEEKIFQLVRFQYLFMSFLGFMVMMHIDVLIRVWIGSEFDMVSQIIKVMMIIFLFPNAGVFLMIYYAQGKTKINRIYVTLNTLSSFLLSIIAFIITNDIILFAYVFSSIQIIVSLLSIRTYINYFDLNMISFIKDSVIIPLFILLIVIFVIESCRPFLSFDIFGLILSIIVSLVLYIILFFILMKSEDKQMVFRLFERGKNIDS